MPESIGLTFWGGSLALSIDGTTMTKVAQVVKVDHSGQQASFAEITNSDSPDRFEEFVPTSLTPGNLDVDVVVKPDDPGQTLALAAFQSQTKLFGELDWPKVGTQTNAAKSTFSCYVSQAPLPSFDIKNAATMRITLRITGAIATTPGS